MAIALLNARRTADVRVWARSLTIVLLGLSMVTMGRSQESFDEYRVKAAFLYNFAKFIEWPPSGPVEPDRPFTICVVGDDPFGPHLRAALEGKSIENRKAAVRHFPDPANFQACPILFIAVDDPRQAALVSKAVEGLPVLLVGESKDFLESGGIIRMYVDHRKIRFEIHAGNAKKIGLTIRAPLLNLASSVRQGL